MLHIFRQDLRFVLAQVPSSKKSIQTVTTTPSLIGEINISQSQRVSLLTQSAETTNTKITFR